MRRVIAGALSGLLVGLLALTTVLIVSVQCLPYRISMPAQPWPEICSNPVYGVITFLAFPVNLMTDEISKAILLSPLSLVMYVILGILIATSLKSPRPGVGDK